MLFVLIDSWELVYLYIAIYVRAIASNGSFGSSRQRLHDKTLSLTFGTVHLLK